MGLLEDTWTQSRLRPHMQLAERRSGVQEGHLQSSQLVERTASFLADPWEPTSCQNDPWEPTSCLADPLGVHFLSG